MKAHAHSAGARAPARGTRRLQRLVTAGGAILGLTLGTAIGVVPGAPPPRRVVYIDELGAFEPNPGLARRVSAELASGGYAMTYVPPMQASVQRLRSLPRDRAQLIILRAHAALIVDGGRLTDEAALFSAEPVDLARFDVSGLRALDPRGLTDSPRALVPAAPVGASRLSNAAAAALVPVRRAAGADRRPYLGLGPRFVRDHLRGRFRDDAIVLLMGCDTMRGRGLSEAFLARGAKAVIGWSDQVSAGHNDRSLGVLARQLASPQASVDAALRAVMDTVGADPVSGAYLVAAQR